MSVHYLGFVLLLGITTGDGLKVLIDQIGPSYSHVRFAGALADALVERGHTVDTVLRVFHPMIPTNGTNKARRIYRIEPHRERPIPFAQIGYLTRSFDRLHLDPWDPNMLKSNMILCDEMLGNEELMAELKAESYDVGLTPSYTGCGTGLFHLLGIKSTHTFLPFASWDGIYEALGIPVPPNYVPGVCLDTAKTTEPTIWERLYSLYRRWHLKTALREAIDAEGRLFEKRFPNFPNLFGLFQKHSYFFQNTDEVLDFQRPINWKIRNIGGIAVGDSKPLSAEYAKIITEKANGVVLVSFGSLIRTSQIPTNVQREIVAAFGQFPDRTFLWKHDNPDHAAALIGNHSNVRLVKWIPQNDLLNNKNIRAFITHAGLNSYIETARAGVPVVAIPQVGDQQYNAAAAVQRNIGVIVEPQNLNEKTLVAALHRVLDTDVHLEAARELQRLLKRKPTQPKDYFVDLLEYAAAHPQLGELLSLPGRDLSTIVYYSLDLWAMLVAALFGMAFGLHFLIQRFSVLSFESAQMLKNKAE